MKALTTWTCRNGQYYLTHKKILPLNIKPRFISGSQVLIWSGLGEFSLVADFFTLPKIGKSGRPHRYMEFPKNEH
ncbi:MAG: hypothetical protein D4R39_00935 [Methylophilaceae bacterium]|nr:MAG: hypothetical protein D4R39_00935 [Methylophilaceae bacterium]